MADGIGNVEFLQSIVRYVILLVSLGIPMYAVREIARIRDDFRERNKVLLEIFILNLILTFLGYCIIFILAVTVEKISFDIPLFLILSLSVFLTTIGCEWFYQGVEDFKYITIRGIIVRCAAIIFLFVFVKEKSDILYYAVFTIISSVGGNIFNFFRLKKYLGADKIIWKELKPFRHFKPALGVFVLNLIISIYVNLNAIMLGFMKDNESVGLFASAAKLTQVVLTIVTSLGVVLLPRMSNMISNNQMSDFWDLAQKSLNFIVLITLPITLGLILLSDDIILIFAGASYTGAVPVLVIISPIVLLIAVSNVLGIQILYPQGHEKIVIFSTSFGAFANFIINLWLIPKYSQNGAAAATLIAELIVTVSMLVLGRPFLRLKWEKRYWGYMLGTLCMGIAVYLLKMLHYDFMVNFATVLFGGVLVYLLFLIFTKDPLYLMAKNSIFSRIKIKNE